VSITIHGSGWDAEIPFYGSKVIGVRNGTLDIHGTVRAVAWTVLTSTATAATNTLEVTVAVDWKSGDRIAIASSALSADQMEYHTIASVSGTGTTITTVNQLAHTHVSGI
jgi:hypothetical protein